MSNAALVRKIYGGTNPRPVATDLRAVREPDWPPWAKALKHLATPADRGIGDVVARTIGPENSQAFKAFYKNVTGKHCGCTGRQADWNVRFPLPRKPPASPLQSS